MHAFDLRTDVQEKHVVLRPLDEQEIPKRILDETVWPEDRDVPVDKGGARILREVVPDEEPVQKEIRLVSQAEQSTSR